MEKLVAYLTKAMEAVGKALGWVDNHPRLILLGSVAVVIAVLVLK